MKWEKEFSTLHAEILGHLDDPRLTLSRVALHPLADDSCFTDVALRIYEFQKRHNSFYRRYVELTGTPKPQSWREIPAVWTNAFKRARVATFPKGRTIACFRTSGTTEGEGGVHEFCDLELYRRAALSFFRTALLPDDVRQKMLFLSPPPADAPHSSLIFMFESVRKAFGATGSRYFFRNDALDTNALCRSLSNACRTGEPLFLLGTAFAFAYLLQDLDKRQLRFQLPPGSRIMETGGFKGRVKEIPRDEFYFQLQHALGIPRSHIVNEYGMTELSSQFYYCGLALTLAGRRIPASAMSVKVCPPWTRVLIVDPETGREVQVGAQGLIRIYDLANLGSVVAIQTEDIGVRRRDGFEILGRAPLAPPRGCSLDAERLILGESSHETIAIRKSRSRTS